MKLAWFDYGAGIPQYYRDVTKRVVRDLSSAPGVEVVRTFDQDETPAREIIHIAPPQTLRIRQGHGKRHWVIGLWDLEEFKLAPPDPGITIFAGSRFLADHALKYGCPVIHLPLGVDHPFLEVDTHRPIIKGAGPVRFLWYGSPFQDEWKLMIDAWRDAFSSFGGLVSGVDAEIRIKTEGIEGVDDQVTEQTSCGRRLLSDKRRLNVGATAQLFAETDVFIASPNCVAQSPLIDAMAAGCLVINNPGRSSIELTDEFTALIWKTPAQLAEVIGNAAKLWGTQGLEALRESGIRRARKYDWGETCARILGAIRGTVLPEEPKVQEAPKEPSRILLEA